MNFADPLWVRGLQLPVGAVSITHNQEVMGKSPVYLSITFNSSQQFAKIDEYFSSELGQRGFHRLSVQGGSAWSNGRWKITVNNDSELHARLIKAGKQPSYGQYNYMVETEK